MLQNKILNLLNVIKFVSNKFKIQTNLKNSNVCNGICIGASQHYNNLSELGYLIYLIKI